MADYLARTTGTSVSHHWIANLWREYGLKPQKQGTFKLSKDPAFADKAADISACIWSRPAARRAQSRREDPDHSPSEPATGPAATVIFRQFGFLLAVAPLSRGSRSAAGRALTLLSGCG